MAPGLTLASLVIALKHTDTKPPCTGCFVTDLCVFQRPAGRLILVQATMQRTSMAPISRTVGSTQREKNAAFKHRALASNLAHERFLIVLKNWHAYCVNPRSEEHTSELQSLMRTSYAVFCLKKKKHHK